MRKQDKMLEKMKLEIMRILPKGKIIRSGNRMIGVEVEEKEEEEVDEIIMMIENVQKAHILKSKEQEVDKSTKDVEEGTTIEVTMIKEMEMYNRYIDQKMINQMIMINLRGRIITKIKNLMEMKAKMKNQNVKTIMSINETVVVAEEEVEVDVAVVVINKNIKMIVETDNIKRGIDKTTTIMKKENTNQKTKIEIRNLAKIK